MRARAEAVGEVLRSLWSNWQGYYLAVVADSCLARGTVEAAITKAREGTEVVDAGGTWFQAAVASAALADAMGAPDPADRLASELAS